MTSSHRRLLVALTLAMAMATAACGATGSSERAAPKPVTLRLLAHDSFAVSDDVLAGFTKDTGIKVKLIQGGDAGTVVNQAILAKGNPQADVLFGVDSTFLSRALDKGLFVPYNAAQLGEVDDAFILDRKHRVTPVDYGDVCLNYDKSYFAEHHLAVPTRLEQLTEPAYRDLTVVENPATSSPGLAFLLATIDVFGADGWQQFWRSLRANGVHVSDGWEDAYYSQFSGGATSEGTRPIVVSYASSPPAEVIYADPPVSEAPTGVITAGCYRQVEFAGILTGTAHEEAARRLIDFLISKPFQADVPQSMFVYPVRSGVALPPEFVADAVAPNDVAELAPDVIGEHREEWIKTWTDLVVR
jgi:thiamine transport system substrate-binding protein